LPFNFDCNLRNEEINFDSKGFFLLDTRSKPAIPLVAGLPLSYQSKEKDYDNLSDKAGSSMFQFNK
jgi:hypothetical protein